MVSPFAKARSLTHSLVHNFATPSPKHVLKCMQVYDMLWLCIRCIHVIYVWLVDCYVFFHTATLVIISAMSAIVVVIIVIIFIISVLAFLHVHLHIRKNRAVKLGIL